MANSIHFHLLLGLNNMEHLQDLKNWDGPRNMSTYLTVITENEKTECRKQIREENDNEK